MRKVLSGIVISGKRKGKKLGFPTANIKLSRKIKTGVYSGFANAGGRKYKAGIYISRDEKILEAHLLDFSGNLRGKEIEIEIGKKIRKVRRFNNDEDLKARINADIRRIRSGYTRIDTHTSADDRSKLLYKDITYKIRGACFEVYNQFGGAFKERIIENALVDELKTNDLDIESQKRIDIYYKKNKVGTYIPDMIINNIILIELKCKPFLTREDEKQFWLYLKGSEYKLGLLINFGSKRLEIKRRIYDQARNKSA